MSLRIGGTVLGTLLILIAAGTIAGSLSYLGSSNLYGTGSQGLPSPPPGSVLVVIVRGAASNQSLGFSPGVLTLVLGVNSTVMFYNDDVAIHTATAAARAFDTGNIYAKQSVVVELNQTGTYDFVCLYHPWMTGRIVVVTNP